MRDVWLAILRRYALLFAALLLTAVEECWRGWLKAS